MSKQLLVVFGATGNQGHSVIQFLLNHPELSSQYSVRAVTRNANTPTAQTLSSQGIEVVTADLNDPSSLPAALRGASFVFATTNSAYEGNTREVETRQAKALCEESIKQGIKYIIWSTLPHPEKISGGKAKVEHFDVKAEIEEYIRGLPIDSAFVAPGSFMQNMYSVLAPRKSAANDGSYIFTNMVHPTKTLFPLFDATDVGAWTNAVLAEPAKYEGKFFAAAQGFYSMEDMARIMSKVSGKTVEYERISEEQWQGSFPEPLGHMMLETGIYQRDYGYYGPNMKEDVEWAQKQVQGQLTDFESFLRKTEFKLE
ncbi:unnamed protein product [Periconia digitata]|uniref:NmrA-like domain-containing protein n=1 Tax=Periconia digitata TaxID=1303443 RepID=A0A9W4XRC5_9PLEO|nr:unnamed protein product [Periconia digitata]